jgi:hypothetical protein
MTMNKKVALLAGAALLAAVVVAAVLLLTFGQQDNSAQLAECSRTLHAAQEREEVWTYPPIGYDLDGRPAIVFRRGVVLGQTQVEILAIVQATECLVSKGKWWDRPIDLIEDHIIVAHYTGTYVRKVPPRACGDSKWGPWP